MEKLYEKILNKLTEEDRDIVKSFNENELLKLKHQNQVLQAENEKEIIKLQSQNENELLKLKHQNEKEIIKLESQNENELLKLKHQIELLEGKYETMKEALTQANWEKLAQSDLVSVRSFIDFFDRNRLNFHIRERNKRFDEFIEKKENELKEWGLSVGAFKKMFPMFYDKLCRSAHPTFNSSSQFIIINDCLEASEIKIVGFLWEVYPLPMENLVINDKDKCSIVLEDYKN
ncbi:hypothetical protein RI129_010946 [Pyrocoelia pectoralis]|uniref:Uncharacterized protein n=1 Tax=Pyrocoelia pectoralis TaxID=417401 RepID=A0AAN7UZY4_9COLE